MACHIRITGRVDLAAAKILGELVADTSARHVRSPGPGIYLVNDEEDDFCDIESFCVERGIGFERVTYRPSQMGQEPHRVTFLAGMSEPALVLL
jgi:hypothetical protein